MRFASRSALLCAPFAALRHASSVVDELKDAILARHRLEEPKIKILKEKFGKEKLSDASIDSAYGGMRGITGLVYEPSLLDPNEGIRFRGRTIPECCAQLPKSWLGGTAPLPEAMLWLLLTGAVPTASQARALSGEIHSRRNVAAAAAAARALSALPDAAHPMTQLSVGVLSLQPLSKFAAAHTARASSKATYWEYALEDALDLLARVPEVAAMVYNRLVHGRAEAACAAEAGLDWAANFTAMLGFSDPQFWDGMRLYLAIHADHEGGNVSAHTTTLVASALSDPYLALSAGLNGLAGPLHGLANQESLEFIFEMRARCKAAGLDLRNRTELAAGLEKFTWEILNAKRVVPGYGHAVLRRTDPRYTCFQEFCAAHFPDDELFLLVDTIYSIMPGILTKHGKTKNPYPNVDAHSGVVLQHFGLTQMTYYTVLFGVSRQIGVLAGVIWDRLQGRPIERPKSTTTETLIKKFNL